MSFDSASVPKFDPQKPFKVWYRKWLDFCIGKRWESLYETGARGVFQMPVVNDEGQTGMRNNEVRDSDRRIVRSALLCAFDEALRESYDDEDAFPSALSIVKDLKQRYDTRSRFRAQRILHQVLGMECKDINRLQDYFETFRRMVTQIKSAGGLFQLDKDTEVYLLTNAIKVESLKELVENIKAMDDMTADRAIEMLSARVESLKDETGSLTKTAVWTEAAMAAKFKFPGNCYECGKRGHRRDDCPEISKCKCKSKKDKCTSNGDESSDSSTDGSDSDKCKKHSKRKGQCSSGEHKSGKGTAQKNFRSKKASMLAVAKPAGPTVEQLIADIWNLGSSPGVKARVAQKDTQSNEL